MAASESLEAAVEAADAPDPADEIAILFPDRAVAVRDPDSGEKVEILCRAFRFRESLDVGRTAAPLIAELADCAGRGGRIRVDAIEGAMAAHADLWIDVCAASTGRDAAWIGRLDEVSGIAVSNGVWAANSRFFTRRVLDALRDARSSSEESSPTSSDTGTAATTTSAGD